ncbi:hypothetical protein KC340_g145 [Hortaea werneckii]|nr:hypothetical protein KC340_g145 [Hortaea werneckii]
MSLVTLTGVGRGPSQPYQPHRRSSRAFWMPELVASLAEVMAAWERGVRNVSVQIELVRFFLDVSKDIFTSCSRIACHARSELIGLGISGISLLLHLPFVRHRTQPPFIPWTRFLVAPSIILPVRRVWLAGWLADTLLLQAIPLSKQVFLDPVSATKNKTPLPTESKIQDIDNVSTDIMSCKAVQMVPQTKQSGKRKDKELHPKRIILCFSQPSYLPLYLAPTSHKSITLFLLGAAPSTPHRPSGRAEDGGHEPLSSCTRGVSVRVLTDGREWDRVLLLA